MTPASLEPAALWSQVKHPTTEPLRSLFTVLWAGLQFVIVAFPGHTHLQFRLSNRQTCFELSFFTFLSSSQTTIKDFAIKSTDVLIYNLIVQTANFKKVKQNIGCLIQCS